MANDNWFGASLGNDEMYIEEDLGVPKPPQIFQNNILFLKNKNVVMLLAFLFVTLPLIIAIIDVRHDGPTFVDLDIKKFILEKHKKVIRHEDAASTSTSDGISPEGIGKTKNMRIEKKTIKNITFGVTSCGERVLENALTSTKSMLISSMNYGVEYLDGRIFVETAQRSDDLSTILEEMKDRIPSSSSLKFSYEIYILDEVVPKDFSYLWIELYKQCSAVHLFIEKAIPDINEILFLDAGTLVLGDLREVWSYFGEMDNKQFMGLALEQATSGFPSFYEKHSRAPFVSPSGVNTGVMLVNLTRMRHFDWESKVTNVMRSFAHDLLKGDQDIINALFFFNREYLQILPCIHNFRKSNCKVEQHCREAASHADGIQILHGSSNSFEINGEFRMIYDFYRKFNLKTLNFKRDIVKPVITHYENFRKSRTFFNSGCVAVGRQMFNRWWNHKPKNGGKKEL